METNTQRDRLEKKKNKRKSKLSKKTGCILSSEWGRRGETVPSRKSKAKGGTYKKGQFVLKGLSSRKKEAQKQEPKTKIWKTSENAGETQKSPCKKKTNVN